MSKYQRVFAIFEAEIVRLRTLWQGRPKYDVADESSPLALCQGFNGLCACRNRYEFPTCAKAAEPLRQAQGRFVGDVKSDQIPR